MNPSTPEKINEDKKFDEKKLSNLECQVQKDKYSSDERITNSFYFKYLFKNDNSHNFSGSKKIARIENSILKRSKYDKIIEDIEKIIEKFSFDDFFNNLNHQFLSKHKNLDEIYLPKPTSKCLQLNKSLESLRFSSEKKSLKKGFPVYLDIEDLKIKEDKKFFMEGIYTKKVSGNLLRFYNIFDSSTVRLYKTLKVKMILKNFYQI